MADVFVTLAAPWEGHQIEEKVRVSEMVARQLRRAGVAQPEGQRPAKSAPKKAQPKQGFARRRSAPEAKQASQVRRREARRGLRWQHLIQRLPSSPSCAPRSLPLTSVPS
jgi:hypothetical protein